MDFKFNLGDKVKHDLTDYTGTIIARTQWLSNCNTYSVKSRALREGRPIDAVTFDEPELALIKPKTHKESRDTGGPTEFVRRTNR